jgi:integrase
VEAGRANGFARVRVINNGGRQRIDGSAPLPRRKPNAEYRSREHLTEREVERLIEAMKGNRWGHRDATMVLIAFRHGLRASELVDLRWDQIDLERAILHVHRLKNGSPATHPIDRQGITRPEAAPA